MNAHTVRITRPSYSARVRLIERNPIKAALVAGHVNHRRNAARLAA